MFDQFTCGIEEEVQFVDPESRELRSHGSEFLDEGKMIDQARDDPVDDRGRHRHLQKHPGGAG